MISGMPAAASQSRGVPVFCSYSHKDEALRAELQTHLKALERAGLVSVWHDRRIAAGSEWETEIRERLEQARIILLLVTADFIASDYCWDLEMERALARHRAGDARVIPVILEPAYWRLAPFACLQALPRGGVPVTSWPNRDEAFESIVSGVKEAAEELLARDARSAAGEFTVEVWTAAADESPQGGCGSEYRIGDGIVVHFRANRDCYLTLLNIGTSGNLTILFPNGFHPDNRIRAERLYTIPGPEYGFEYRLSGPPGAERLKAIATLKPVEMIPADFDTSGALFKSAKGSAAARDIAIIETRAKAVPSNDIASAETQLRVTS
jgi:hypothetical protein